MMPLVDVFRPPTHLHLVIWNRIDASDHAAAMNALLSLANSEFADQIMPLLRPLGRQYIAYEGYQSNFASCEYSKLKNTPLFDGVRSAHCEIWLQVSDCINCTLRPEVEQMFDRVGSACFFWEHQNPLWAPLGQNMNDCQYAQARHGRGTAVLCSMQAQRVAWFLKLIWYRAAEEILQWMQENKPFVPIHPIGEKPTIRGIMTKLCSDIDLKKYGLSSDSLLVDPTDYGASHLAAFSLNAITRVQVPTYFGLEQYYGSEVFTRPGMMPDRDSFLGLFI